MKETRLKMMLLSESMNFYNKNINFNLTLIFHNLTGITLLEATLKPLKINLHHFIYFLLPLTLSRVIYSSLPLLLNLYNYLNKTHLILSKKLESPKILSLNYKTSPNFFFEFLLKYIIYLLINYF
jgi:hypothetical protein